MSADVAGWLPVILWVFLFWLIIRGLSRFVDRLFGGDR